MNSERERDSETDAVRDSLKHTELQYHSDSLVSLTLFLPDGKRERKRERVLQSWGSPRGFLICYRMKVCQITERLMSLGKLWCSRCTLLSYLWHWGHRNLFGDCCTCALLLFQCLKSFPFPCCMLYFGTFLIGYNLKYYVE